MTDEQAQDGRDEQDDELALLSPEDEARVSAALRGGATAPAMPAEVWLSLERALMDESARREQGMDGHGAPSASTRGRSRLRTASIFGLAAAVALVVGGTVIATIDRQQGGQGPAPVAAGGSSAVVLASGTDYAPQTLAAQVKATVAELRSSLRRAAPAAPTGEVSPASIGASSAGPMAGMPDMHAMAATQAPRQMPEGMPADMPFLHDTAHFQDCLHEFVRVSQDDQVAVLLVDIATMQGVVTAVIVVPAMEMPADMGVDPAMEQVFVVSPACAVRAHAQVDLDAA